MISHYQYRIIYHTTIDLFTLLAEKVIQKSIHQFWTIEQQQKQHHHHHQFPIAVYCPVLRCMSKTMDLKSLSHFKKEKRSLNIFISSSFYYPFFFGFTIFDHRCKQLKHCLDWVLFLFFLVGGHTCRASRLCFDFAFTIQRYSSL